jgi:Fic family protein
MPRGRPTRADVLARLDELIAHFHLDYGGLPRAVEADQILREIWLEDTYHSSALEGAPLSKKQVVALVEEGQASGPLTDTLEVRGYSDAAAWVYRVAGDHPPVEGVPLAVVRRIHEMLMRSSWTVKPFSDGSRPGEWREQPVRISNSKVATTVPAAIAADMEAWSRQSSWTPASAKKYGHFLEFVADLHASFERIHPFADGNGRTGRLVLNFLLMQVDYPPAVFDSTERLKYLRALAAADGGNLGPLTELMARAIEESVNAFLIPKLAGEARLVPLASLVDYSGYTSAYLRSLANTGRLRATREGRMWLSSRSWVDEYKASRSSRGRRSTKAP